MNSADRATWLYLEHRFEEEKQEYCLNAVWAVNSGLLQLDKGTDKCLGLIAKLGDKIEQVQGFPGNFSHAA